MASAGGLSAKLNKLHKLYNLIYIYEPGEAIKTSIDSIVTISCMTYTPRQRGVLLQLLLLLLLLLLPPRIARSIQISALSV